MASLKQKMEQKHKETRLMISTLKQKMEAEVKHREQKFNQKVIDRVNYCVENGFSFHKTGGSKIETFEEFAIKHVKTFHPVSNKISGTEKYMKNRLKEILNNDQLNLPDGVSLNVEIKPDDLTLCIFTFGFLC